MIFFLRGGGWFYQGFLGKMVYRTWFFCGEFVVMCVTNVVLRDHVLSFVRFSIFENLFFAERRAYPRG